jgi:hypothetical protein
MEIAYYLVVQSMQQPCSSRVSVELPAGGIPYAAPIHQRPSYSWEKNQGINIGGFVFAISAASWRSITQKKCVSHLKAWNRHSKLRGILLCQ